MLKINNPRETNIKSLKVSRNHTYLISFVYVSVLFLILISINPSYLLFASSSLSFIFPLLLLNPLCIMTKLSFPLNCFPYLSSNCKIILLSCISPLSSDSSHMTEIPHFTYSVDDPAFPAVNTHA